MKKILLVMTSFFVLESCSSIEKAGTAVFSDTAIKGRVEYLWFGTKKDSFNGLVVRVQDGRVLIAGKVNKPEDHIEAIRLAWQAEGVKEVADQITVGESTWGSYAQDSWITLQINNFLLWELGFSSSHYNVSTINGVVYVLGIAADDAELTRTLEQARRVKGVRNVVSFVRLKDETKG